MNAAIYTRVSSFEQARDGYSLDAQKRTLEKYAEAMNYSIFKHYSDEGIPGKQMKNRPGLLNMLEDVRQEKVSVVLIWKITRLGRNTVELLQMCDLFKKYNVRLISITESFDTNTSMGKLFFCVLSAFAEYENEVRAENIRAGLEERARQGRRTFARAFGFDIDGEKTNINEKERDQLLYFHHLFQNIQNLNQCAKILRQKGCVGKKGVPLSAGALASLLSSLASISVCQIKKSGELFYLKDVPELIDPSIFIESQRILVKIAKRKNKDKKFERYQALKKFIENERGCSQRTTSLK